MWDLPMSTVLMWGLPMSTVLMWDIGKPHINPVDLVNPTLTL
jgi:hypothetical protein